jgi:hypothetical protein
MKVASVVIWTSDTLGSFLLQSVSPELLSAAILQGGPVGDASARDCQTEAVASRPDPLLGYAVHFTRGNSPADVAKALARPLPNSPGHMELMQWLYDIDATGYRASLSILWQGLVQPTGLPRCVGKDVAGLEDAHRSACFSESPLDKLARLIKKRSVYGVGFRQEFLRNNRGQPVKYLQRGGAEAQWWAQEISRRCVTEVHTEDPLWQKTPFVDELDPDPAEDTRWEKEWRVPGGLKFLPDDVAFVFLPEELHDNARAFFTEHSTNNSGPAYLGRYLDPRWDRERIQEILTEPVSACVTSKPALSDPQAAKSRA